MLTHPSICLAGHVLLANNQGPVFFPFSFIFLHLKHSIHCIISSRMSDMEHAAGRDQVPSTIPDEAGGVSKVHDATSKEAAIEESGASTVYDASGEPSGEKPEAIEKPDATRELGAGPGQGDTKKSPTKESETSTDQDAIQEPGAIEELDIIEGPSTGTNQDASKELPMTALDIGTEAYIEEQDTSIGQATTKAPDTASAPDTGKKQPNEIRILVMGASGSGKSSFITAAAGLDKDVATIIGHGAVSCTLSTRIF